MSSQDKQKILDFVKGKKLMVLSTIRKGNVPQSAVVAFCETPELEIIFGTFNDSRKYKNLESNNKVSLVIGWDTEENTTVQYEGIAEELKDKELTDYRRIFMQKHPSSMKYNSDLRQKYFKIRPLWVRYSDLAAKPRYIFELEFG